MNETITVTGTDLLSYGVAVVVVLVLLVVAWRVVLATAAIVGAQWLVIQYAADNLTFLLIALGLPALFAGYVLAEAATGSAVRSRRGGRRR